MVFGPSVYDVPLLPYEKQLIETIGITEKEYQLFAAEVRRRGRLRPAEYAHIPDIQAAEAVYVPVLISLAISLTLTGVAYLLMPKPKEPAAFSRRELGGATGASRFTPSRGFETLAELGEYASPIPLLFGLYREGYGGGMLSTPKLIWSRMFSHGTLQRAKLLYVVGEQGVDGLNGIDPPELEGIFLGNNALDPVFEDAFAFYWKKHSGDQNNRRVRDTNILYGTRAEASSGDPDNAINGEVFYAPTGDEINAVGQFCHAYTPANSTQFGVFEPIANGNAYRPNYRIVSILEDGYEEGAGKRAATRTRIKFAGLSFNNSDNLSGKVLLQKVRKKGQAGAGRNYSPRMGIVRITRSNGSVETTTGDDLSKVVAVSVGDKIAFVISTTSINEDIYAEKRANTRESVADINSTVESMQLAADDAMQVGEQFAIAGTIWKVTHRKLERFSPGGENAVDDNQEIDLECINTDESQFNLIGIVSLSKVVEPSQDFIGDDFPDGPPASIGEGFYPITKVASATVRNNRPAVVTEIGLKSTVFQKLNGLCAFNSLPTPDELNDLDKDNIQVSNGTITANIMRSTVFRVFVRKAGDSNSSFAVIPMFFLIRGSRPVAQYNFIRFALAPGQEAQELEFKFVQFPGAEMRKLPDTETLMDLSHSVSDQSTSIEFRTLSVDGIGSMTIGVSGKQIAKGSITKNKEFMREPQPIAGTGSSTFPDSVVRVSNAPAPVPGTEAKAIQKIENVSNQNQTYGGKMGAFAHTIIGNASDLRIPSPFNIVTQEFLSDNPRKWLSIYWTYERVELSPDHFARKYNGATHTWGLVSTSVLGSSGNFKEGDKFEARRGSESTENLNSSHPAYPDSNPFKNNPDAPSGQQTINYSGLKFEVTLAERTEVVIGRRQAYLYQVFGDATGPGLSVGTQRTVEREFTKGSKTMQVKLTSTVQFSWPDTRGMGITWTAPQVVVEKGGGTSQTWEKGETFEDLITLTSNNPYLTEAYPKAGFVYQVGNVIQNNTPVEFTSTQIFAHQTQYVDISFYRDFVDKSNAGQPEHEVVYVNEVQENERLPSMNDLVLAGLSLKATRNFTRLDQLRMWLGKGLRVERLHPDRAAAYGDSDVNGPSNLFTDLIYYMMTDQMGGAGALLGMTSDTPVLINKDDLIATSRFLETQKLFFNGPIVERTNLRQFIASVAPFFLCNFVIADGKFSLKPALPTYDSGSFNDGPVPIEQLFTAGNILEDTLEIEYLSAEERRPFKAVVRYREERKNKLPQERTVVVRNKKNDQYLDKGLELLPHEQFDLTQFCTSKDHAVKVAKYFLALRRLITHTISFSTTVDGLAIQAGSYIRVITESSPYSSANSGTVSSTGAVTSVTELADGMYPVDYYRGGNDDVQTGEMQITGGTVAATEFHGVVFSVRTTTVSQNVYVIEQLTFSQEGTVDIVASEHPCDDDRRSLLVAAMLNFDEVEII